VLHSLKTLIELHGKAVAVPVRFDLIDKPDELKQTLNCLDGVIFPGRLFESAEAR
jgi:hypothetical protein